MLFCLFLLVFKTYVFSFFILTSAKKRRNAFSIYKFFKSRENSLYFVLLLLR